MTAVAREVATLRKVEGSFSPPCRAIVANELREELDRKLRRDLPIQPELYLEALRRLGIVDGEPSTVYSDLLEFYAGQVLGFYDPGRDEMVVVSGERLGGPAMRLVWAHELAHAAQESRYHLPSRLLGMRANGDEQRAASAVAEGEALLVMFLLASPGSDARALDQAVEMLEGQAAAGLASARVPEFFVQDLLFPYAKGFSTVVRAYREGGWQEVDRLLSSPPPSTALLLHPNFPEVRQLGDDTLPPVPAGWEEVVSDTLGEWTLGFWLSRRFPAEKSRRLAAGWCGDRLRLVRNRQNTDHWALAWRLVTSNLESRELTAALQQGLPGLLARLPGRNPPLELAWTIAGTTIELRANWPKPAGEDKNGRRLPATHGPAPDGSQPLTYLSSTTTTDFMTTGSRGTASLRRPGSTLTLAMASTTFMPSTTLPNTQ